ncbi:362f99c7-f507-49c3-a835-a0503c8ca62c [Sclerotinia trifoliorum]|uniref:362f99c7-f507-49c3-a835-a0503c8ca62c n=1 Tax=Sclerotinia trifoliorum TaxID=28548 RepID=A0A8H2ZPZ8_9HELO|nr:362f99c7-f507-49c3-a835-a0503c8ca62c [Sclerotinia trifoliorum]
MAPWTSKPATAQDHEHDLSSMLEIEERVDLTLLIADITEVMQKQICDNLDASTTTEETPDRASKVGDKNDNANHSQPKEESEEEEKARKLRGKREKELSAPKMLQLKHDALKFFQEWQEAVISRIGTVVNNPKEVTEDQKKKASANSTPDAPSKTKVVRQTTNVVEADAALIELYPPTSTPLYSLPEEKRVMLLHAMLLLLLSLEHYTAHSRILLLHTASSLHLPLHILAETEVKVAQGLVEAAKKMSGNEETQKRSEENKIARRWKVGLAGVAGAAIVGVTGGLAAPLVAGALGTVMGGLGLGATTAAGLLGALAESGIIVGSLFGAYGASMTGKMMDAYAKEVSDFAFLPLKGSQHQRPLKEIAAKDRRLRVTIGVSGWLTQKEDVVTPWRVLGHQSEVFALRYELEALSKLGMSLESMVKSAAWSIAKKEIISRTIFASLMTALWPLGLLKISKIVDNPFSVAKNRADKAGLVLADALINKAQGERPVTLIGYSLGARLIYSCLMSLAERRAFGLVESAVLIGAPAPSDAAAWRSMRSVVSGRLVNVYSENDYILAFLYRTSSIQFGVAGLQEAQEVKGIENVNVSEMVNGHLRYQYLVGTILEKIGFEDIDMEEVAKEEETLELLEQQERKEEEEKGNIDHVDPEAEVTKMEKDVQRKTAETMMQQGAEKLHIN